MGLQMAGYFAQASWSLLWGWGVTRSFSGVRRHAECGDEGAFDLFVFMDVPGVGVRFRGRLIHAY